MGVCASTPTKQVDVPQAAAATESATAASAPPPVEETHFAAAVSEPANGSIQESVNAGTPGPSVLEDESVGRPSVDDSGEETLILAPSAEAVRNIIGDGANAPSATELTTEIDLVVGGETIAYTKQANELPGEWRPWPASGPIRRDSDRDSALLGADAAAVRLQARVRGKVARASTGSIRGHCTPKKAASAPAGIGGEGTGKPVSRSVKIKKRPPLVPSRYRTPKHDGNEPNFIFTKNPSAYSRRDPEGDTESTCTRSDTTSGELINASELSSVELEQIDEPAHNAP